MKGDKQNYPVSLIWLLVGIFIAVAWLNTAWASDRITQSNDMNNQTGGDINHESKALGLGRSSFDVDINQCMGSTAWDTVLGGKQKLVLNWVCLAEFYIKTGQPELAAVALCNTEMLDEFANEAECESAHDFLVEVAAAVAADPMASDHLDEEEEWHEEQMQMQQDYDDRLAMLEERASRPAPRPKVIEQTVQQPYLSDAKKAALAELIE